jgi:serine protease
MNQSMRRSLLARLLAVFAMAALCARAEDEKILSRSFALKRIPAVEMTNQLIVRFKDESATGRRTVMSYERARALSERAGLQITPMRPMSIGAQVVKLPQAMRIDDVRKIAASIARDPNVAYAFPDQRRYPHASPPSDPAYSFLDSSGIQAGQWYLFDPTGGINAPAAWNITIGSSAVVVAVLDTGVISTNTDLNGRLLGGYDFLSGDNPCQVGSPPCPFATANDGDGRDPDPSDPGDWLTVAEQGVPPFDQCPPDPTMPAPIDSSWHGTLVAALLGATANNGFGIAGVNWVSPIQPVRVLGKCGGNDSDITDAMMWAAGFPVPGAGGQTVINATPAQIINLSLGSISSVPSPCSQTLYPAAISQILATGRVKAIVTSAGNDAGDASQSVPGSCSGVINVAATTRTGGLASYSNSGAAITISAPGGDFGANNSGPPRDGVLAFTDCGTTSPVPSALASTCPDPRDTPQPYIGLYFAGTSVATPLVSGVISLMLAANPTLTSTDVRNILTSTARAFPNSSCTTTTCGAGIVNAGAAVQKAATMSGGISPPAPSSGGGGGGGGGCTTGSGPADLGLPLLAMLALAGVRRKRSTDAH